MATATNFLRKAGLDHALGIATFTAWTASYLGLATASPGDAGSTAGEPVGGNYARQELTSKMAAAVLADGKASLASMVQWPAPDLNQGTITYGFVADALAGGNVLLYDELDTPLPLPIGASPARFAPAEITYELPLVNATDLLRKNLIDHVLRKSTYAKPTCYAGLFTASPGKGGSLAAEATYGAYARVELTSKLAATVLATGVATSSAAVTFPDPSSGSQVLPYIGVMDAATAGNVLFFYPLRRAFIVNSGGVGPSLAAGQIAFRWQ